MLPSTQKVKGKTAIALGAGVAKAVAALTTPAVFPVLLVACSGAPRSDVTAVVDGGPALEGNRADGDVGIADTTLPGDETLPADAFVAKDGASADDTVGGRPIGESGSLDAPPAGDGAGSPGPEGATGEASIDAAGPSFAVVYQTVFQPSCITGCHTATTPMGNLDLSTRAGAYASLVGVLASGPACAFTAEKRVAVGNPAMSLLYTKMVDLEDCGGPMPPLPLDPGSVELVRAWIANGAAK